MITIRRARLEDSASICCVHIRAIREVCKSHYSEKELEAWAAVIRPARYEEAIKKGAFFVAVEGERIIGFGNLNQERGEIEAVYVDPDHVRRGVGMEILQNLEDVARDSGLTSLRLIASLNAVPFYQNGGFKSEQQTKYLLPFEMVACVPMVKELGKISSNAY